MKYNFIEYTQDQQHLLPKDISDWVEEDSLEKFISDTIDYLDSEGRLDPFYPEYKKDGRGRPSFHPVLMLKVLVFGYSIGVRSSRKLDRLLERDVAFRYLAANQQPDFRTISLFRKNNREEFEHLFEEVLRLCRETGLADLGEVALDGRRVQGDAALDKNRTRDALEQRGFEDALYDDKAPGREPALTDAQFQQFTETLHQPPEEAGYDEPAWTTALAQHHLIVEFDVTFSRRHIQRLMNEAEVSWKKPRPEPSSADEEELEWYDEDLEKKSADETTTRRS